jgi:bifunctional ADP-heptose synthase (sugar kinase/adenylyltransferase)
MNNNQSQMNLYIINNVLSDYTSGMVVIAAESKEQCREFFIKEFSDYHAEEFDKYAEFKIIEDVKHPAGVVAYEYGGG